MDSWPATLPQCFLPDELSASLAKGWMESTTDSGVKKRRRQSTAMPRSLSGRMLITPAQLATLKTFYEVTLLMGSLHFTFPDPEGGDDLIVQFAERPEWSKIGGKRLLSLQFDVLP